ncbi:peptidase S8/S53 domain-containing protein [Catenaria anguillulae PL171]|uniref:Peptidase S8/S53 domain-containing protein n=1 Tax=Catenaria anguillulae PL171 TaxID=765915 RepID=A0A1Y2HD41_9FUNG|nr:peptidase S8/S53 domain-containing protein [Catenaria anguillulae PL171]
MKILSLTAILVVLALSLSTTAAPTAQYQAIPNQYIITLKQDADQSQFTRALNSEVERENAQEHVTIQSKIEHTYKIADFQGYAGTFSKDLVQRLKNNPSVAAVEDDLPVYASATQANPPSWGLTRVGQRARSIPGPYVFPDNSGAGVTVYVIDSGVLTTHQDFGGRAVHGFSADPTWPATDDNGHGTHVASTVAGYVHGVAKRANIVAVKVLSSSGAGTTSGIIAGINWVAGQVYAARRTAVANMSLRSGRIEALNNAAAAAVRVGVVVVGAAGNDSQDTCNFSPASEPSIITVASSTWTDTMSSFSNYGRCVDIIAPGSDIIGVWKDGTARPCQAHRWLRTPHVAGAAALLLGANPYLKPQEVAYHLLSRATVNVVSGNLWNPNRCFASTRRLCLELSVVEYP